MIPRTKANYSLLDLLRALLCSEKKSIHRLHLLTFLQEYFSTKHILLTPSGRSGLYTILSAIDRPRVIIPAYTCKAVVEAAKMAGKEVVFIDVEDDGFNMDVDQLSKVIDNDSAVLATHQFGFPCEIERIVELCRSKRALLIEDAAASLGTLVNGCLSGSFGDVSFFSFDSTKLINVPMKGGFIITKDQALFQQIKREYEKTITRMPFRVKVRLLLLGLALNVIENHRIYRIFHLMNFGLRGKYTADSSDLNMTRTMYYRYDFTNWQALIALKQIKQIDEIILKRQQLYDFFLENLSECEKIQLPPIDEKNEWACIRFPIRIPGNKMDYYSNAVKCGLDFSFSFTYIAAPQQFERAHRLAGEVLDLPFYFKLQDAEAKQVVEIIKQLDLMELDRLS